MSPEQIALILGSLGAGGVLIKVIDVLFQGFKDSQIARGLTPKRSFLSGQTFAFWSEKLQETRELYLKEGGDPIVGSAQVPTPKPRKREHQSISRLYPLMRGSLHEAGFSGYAMVIISLSTAGLSGPGVRRQLE